MNYIKSLVVNFVVFLLAVLVFGFELVPIYDSTVLTLVAITGLATITTATFSLVTLLPFMGIGGLVGAALARSDGAQMGVGCGLLVWFPVVIFVWPWVMVKFLVPISWFPPFTYWQLFGVSIVTTLIDMLTRDYSKKESKRSL